MKLPKTRVILLYAAVVLTLVTLKAIISYQEGVIGQMEGRLEALRLEHQRLVVVEADNFVKYDKDTELKISDGKRTDTTSEEPANCHEFLRSGVWQDFSCINTTIEARMSLPNGDWAFSGKLAPDENLCQLYEYGADDIRECLFGGKSEAKRVYIFGDSRARLRVTQFSIL